MRLGRVWIANVRIKKAMLLVVLLGAFTVYELSHWVSQTVEVHSIEATSWVVAHKVVVIDPGHGGADPGAVGPGGAIEKEITLQIGRKVADYLRQAGETVIMTRESDADLSDGGGSLRERKREDLSARLELAHSKHANLFISIHINSFPSSRWYGAQTFYYRDSEVGRQLALAIQSELKRIIPNNNRVAKPENFFILRKAQLPIVNVEVGFISNPREEQLLQQEEYQKRLAWAIYAGIVKYYAAVTSNHPPNQ